MTLSKFKQIEMENDYDPIQDVFMTSLATLTNEDVKVHLSLQVNEFVN